MTTPEEAYLEGRVELADIVCKCWETLPVEDVFSLMSFGKTSCAMNKER